MCLCDAIIQIFTPSAVLNLQKQQRFRCARFFAPTPRYPVTSEVDERCVSGRRTSCGSGLCLELHGDNSVIEF